MATVEPGDKWGKEVRVCVPVLQAGMAVPLLILWQHEKSVEAWRNAT